MILTIDIGSTSLKGALVRRDGKLADYRRIAYPDQFASRNSDIWVAAFSSVVKALATTQVVAISVCGNGPTLVPLNRNGLPITSVLFWRDHPPSQNYTSYYLPGLLAFRDRDPNAFENTSLFLPPAEYLCYLLTGEKGATSPHRGFDKRLWSEEELRSGHLPSEKLPEIRDFKNPVGRVHRNASDRWNLPKNIPVYCPGSDFMAALAGTNTLCEGKICDRAGSSEGINRAGKQSTGGKGLRVIPHLIENLFNTAAFPGQTGLLFETYRKSFGLTDIGYDILLDEFLHWRIEDNRSVFLITGDVEGDFAGQAIPESNKDKMNIVLATLGCLFARSVAALENSGLSVGEIVVSGGQAKNRDWSLVKASFAEKTLLLPEIPDSELTGCALVALADLENTPLVTLASFLVRIRDRIDPDPLLTRKFNHYKTLFSELSSRRGEFYAR